MADGGGRALGHSRCASCVLQKQYPHRAAMVVFHRGRLATESGGESPRGGIATMRRLRLGEGDDDDGRGRERRPG